jgi:hypothetical protein
VKHRRVALVAAVVGAAAIGSVATITLRHATPVALPAPPPVSTAGVVRTDLVTTVLTEGTLGYAPSEPVINQVVGTFTALPAPGTLLGPGQVLYRVDDRPVVLMAGTIPAWRAFAPGMTDGPDVAELESNLIVLGDAAGLFSSAGDHFDGLVADAVKRWQTINGYPANGQISLGQVVFIPNPILVGAVNAVAGQVATPEAMPYQVMTATRIVTVPLNPNLPAISVGESVSIVLPTNIATPGTVFAVGPAPPTSSTGPQSPSSAGSNANTAQPSPPSTVATIVPDRAAATGTGSGVAVQVSLSVQSARDVLAVPISALLALAGGGYGVEVVGPAGVHHLVGVTTGIFTGSQVQVTGTGIAAGTTVVVAQ